jgi:outer membrane protein OmpA-like peptidoglycan-associated protein
MAGIRDPSTEEFMRSSVRYFLFVSVLMAAAALSGCATRHYVKQQVGTIEPQIAGIRAAAAQESERIEAVDRRTKAVVDIADQAAMAAVIANEKAVAADRRAAEADRRADTAQVNAMRALNRIDTVENQLENRIASLDKYSLTEQKIVTFKFDSDVLSKEAISGLDDLAGMISSSSYGYVVEIRGFTDNIGNEGYNDKLSARCAASVLRFLVSSGVPLYRISIVGLGKTSPAADNRTAHGREQNRRVEICVLTSGTVATANR